MATFSDLPNDILLMVMDIYWPLNVDAYRQMCKNTRALTASYLKKHMRLKRRYSHGKYSTITGSGPNGTPVGLLRDILHNPEVAPYLNSLCIVLAENGEAFHPTGTEFNMSKKSVDFFGDAVRNCPMITDNDLKESLLKGFSEGTEEAVITLLLLMLPNLIKLRLGGRRAPEVLDQILNSIGTSQDKAALTQLNTIELDSIRLPSPLQSNQMFTSVSSLPSMRRMSAVDIRAYGIEVFDYFQELKYVAKSPLTHLQLANCDIWPDVLSKVVKSTETLTSFSYCTKGREPDSKWILAMLLSQAGNTLRELTIFSCDNAYMGSLIEFKALEKVSTSIQLLQVSSIPDWNQILPSTLKSLKLHDDGGVDYELLYYSKLMDALLAIKDREIPELEELHYRLSKTEMPSEQNRDTLGSRFARQCAEAGIQLCVDWVSVCDMARDNRVVAEVLKGSGIENATSQHLPPRPSRSFVRQLQSLASST